MSEMTHEYTVGCKCESCEAMRKRLVEMNRQMQRKGGTMTSAPQTPTLGKTPEQHMAESPAIFTQRERNFVNMIREFVPIGYGMMQQLIEWEWQSKSVGAWGPEYFEAQITALQSALAEARLIMDRLRAMQGETHPGWNDEYVPMSWIQAALAETRGGE